MGFSDCDVGDKAHLRRHTAIIRVFVSELESPFASVGSRIGYISDNYRCSTQHQLKSAGCIPSKDISAAATEAH